MKWCGTFLLRNDYEQAQMLNNLEVKSKKGHYYNVLSKVSGTKWPYFTVCTLKKKTIKLFWPLYLSFPRPKIM